RLLAERAAAGTSMMKVHEALARIFNDSPEEPRKLRALWALHCTGGAKPAWLVGQLDHASEHLRAWAVRLLCDVGTPCADALGKFALMADEEKSGLVRLYLASMLQRLPAADRFPIAPRVAARAEDADDANQPLMIWYGIEPVLVGDRSAALKLAAEAR